MNVFITGATGFAGQHLVNSLLSQKHDIFGTSYPEMPEEIHGLQKEQVKENIFHMDIRKARELEDKLKDIQPDWLFHLAAVSNVGQSWEDRKNAMEVNIMGSFNLLEAVRKFTPHTRILFISSSDVYGGLSKKEKRLKETDQINIVNPYALTKANTEMMCHFYASIENLDIIIARAFPHTGPGQNSIFVCSDWALQIARIEKNLAEPVIKVGNLKAGRDFSDVRDVVKAYILLMEQGRKGETYNICSGEITELKTVLDILISYSSKDIQIQVDKEKLRKVDIQFLCGDNQKIKKETGWKPETPLKQTLFDLLEYWRGTI
ncbi:MAG: GDP-mannose 4,6-dehydratase [Candidatus Aminicenantaceae bacterium]